MTYLDRAIKDGYAIITGPENKQKIIYVTSDNHTENYNDPEEKVRAEFWAELIYEYDYPAHRIKVEVTIPDRVPTDRADIVIFSDDECKKPYAVVECKRDGVTDAEFLQAIEQGVGNATWVKLRASYVVIIAGATRRVLDFSDDKSVFMSMKFGEETVNTYQTVKDVKEILKRENNIDLKIIKVDEHEDGYSDEIYHRIIDGIREASLVIADLSYGNKNVHHEIGYAQGIGKKVLLIYQIRDGIDPKEEIGSNISMHDQLRFTNIVELRSQLLKRIRNFFGIPESTD